MQNKNHGRFLRSNEASKINTAQHVPKTNVQFDKKGYVGGPYDFQPFWSWEIGAIQDIDGCKNLYCGHGNS